MTKHRYEIYIVSMGEKFLMLETTVKKEAMRMYAQERAREALVRVAVDGEQLPIYLADKNFGTKAAFRAHRGRYLDNAMDRKKA